MEFDRYNVLIRAPLATKTLGMEADCIGIGASEFLGLFATVS
ncbi:hypothetical protein CEV32_4096 [Brucella rhizosphaerae]|uniref:Uncharacterized protein n=1 Tax=Brucella rhizosphaerae TaxID=571254 RepID=A0A256FPP0_9HYPH|nr:hypothetical protein CEV32_4096 [Brucella rhizosphaerae]